MMKRLICILFVYAAITGISHTQTVEELKTQAESYYNQGYYTDAYKTYDQVLQIDKSDGVAYYMRGMCLMFMQEFGEAIKDFNNAKLISKQKFGEDALTTALPSLRIGICYYYMKKYEEVLTEINEVTIRNLSAYNRFEAYFTRGSAFYMVDNYTSAINEFTSGLQYDPQNAEAWKIKAECNIQLGKLSEAIMDLSNAIAIDSNYAQLYNSRGRVYFVLHKYSEAAADLRKAIQLEPGVSVYYFALSGIEIQQENYPNAIALLDKCVELDPGMGAAYYLRGKCKLQLGQSACDDVKKAYDLGEKDAGEFLKSNCQ